ncbi:LysR family transcriptional regulator [Aquabacterium sp. J223]|uniref:LysR family transcriptional regulator n=1 Tax=Aquabacterium sp. J223 TaxID=2898431 RepID=UPI0021ADD03D|nr:LysR family transcriptional regulator [Aquabacterium sp. J223]UUX95122.1 LysR family transcriptional regulator [Aquabacterium sp. J223]
MRFNKLDLNLLVALDALIEELSISRAAVRLHMSQSAMSNALARLREYFDDPLLVQVGRRMELTPRAEVLREAVRDVLMRVDTSITAQPAFDAARSEREFRISASDYTLLTLMPRVIALAHRQAPRVRFSLVPQVTHATRALELGEVDLLVIPQMHHTPEHPHEVLLQEPFTCVVWQGSRLAEGELTRERYAAAGHVVMVPAGTDQQASVESAFMQRHGLARRVEVTTFSFPSMAALVVGTDRIATLHDSLARQMARQWPLRLHPPPLPLSMSQTMQWHKYRSQDPGLVWLRGLMHAAAAARPAAEPAAA